MNIKLIAVDMDGTFLNSKMDYNRERFKRLYKEMKEKGIHFVVASGNQYYQLRSFFPDIQNEIAFVAENGAYIVNEGTPLFCGELSRDKVLHMIDVLEKVNRENYVMCGEKSAYLHKESSDYFKEETKKYYHKLQQVDNLADVDDKIFKFCADFIGSDIEEVLENLSKQMEDIMVPVSTGHAGVDFIIPGVHKAHGIQMLQELWGIKDEEVMAFGDSGNDLEMLAHAGYGVAMKNAHPKVKAVAKYETDSNDEDGVLNKIEETLNKM